MPLTNQPASKVIVSDCRFGQGVFAGTHIQPGEQILQFTGCKIDIRAALAKGERSGDPLQISDDLYLDLDPPGVFLNHSCDPNSGIMDETCLVALRLIRPGEEIQFDYSTTMSDGMWTMPCDCRSELCRGAIEDFQRMPNHIQQKYLKRGVVQRFIVAGFRQCTRLSLPNSNLPENSIHERIRPERGE